MAVHKCLIPALASVVKNLFCQSINMVRVDLTHVVLEPKQSQPPTMYVAIALCLPRQSSNQTPIQPFNTLFHISSLLSVRSTAPIKSSARSSASSRQESPRARTWKAVFHLCCDSFSDLTIIIVPATAIASGDDAGAPAGTTTAAE